MSEESYDRYIELTAASLFIQSILERPDLKNRKRLERKLDEISDEQDDIWYAFDETELKQLEEDLRNILAKG